MFCQGRVAVVLQVYELTCLIVFRVDRALDKLPQVGLTCFTSVFWIVETMSASQLELCGL